ncbi:DegV family protein [Xylanimonas protaetiae]|uniref:DegV family protein n=1 Tax=Xylanimonas protaetiae TaxID=2509457 RepID=A0A4P6FD46_9MICO|nr:DegV family protein [Xylanimonas protaetiae]QAY71507.1 DegV family protein [Xylanimonas protaetiae]
MRLTIPKPRPRPRPVTPADAARPAVRVVTDSTACLPEAGAADGGPVVVPLQVLTPDGTRREGVDITPAEVARRIGAGQRLTTSQPAPEDFADVYRGLAAEGARAIVSVHLSGDVSGTVTAAAHAGQRAMVPVRAVDSRTAAMALGFAALAASSCAQAGADAVHVAARAREVAASSRCLFLVDSLDHLRRGGRLSAGAAALGAALGVRPILEIVDGQVTLVQRVRTRAAALDRMLALAVAHAATMERPGVAVHHLGAPERAAAAAGRLAEVLNVTPVVTPVSAVLGTHAGPGALAVVVAELGRHEH